LNDIMSPWLSQLKLYLKILGVFYFLENANLLIISDMIEIVIKESYIFNNIVLASYPCVIKAFPKSDIAVIWVVIWNSQNSTKAKKLINRCFNIGCNITTVRGTNINLGVPQCKNC